MVVRRSREHDSPVDFEMGPYDTLCSVTMGVILWRLVRDHGRVIGR